MGLSNLLLSLTLMGKFPLKVTYSLSGVSRILLCCLEANLKIKTMRLMGWILILGQTLGWEVTDYRIMLGKEREGSGGGGWRGAAVWSPQRPRPSAPDFSAVPPEGGVGSGLVPSSTSRWPWTAPRGHRRGRGRFPRVGSRGPEGLAPVGDQVALLPVADVSGLGLSWGAVRGAPSW